MTLLHRLFARWQFAWSLIVLGMLHLVQPSAARAADIPTGPRVHSDALPYLLVVLCLALALILLCRSSSRSKDLRLEELDED
jgi:hypothetical protein